MTIEEQLTEIIKSKYKSIMKFSEVIGVKYTTITGILNDRGILGASVQIVTKICNELEIEVEPLIDGVVCEKRYSERLNLEELQYIKKYRALNEHGKEVVNFILESEYRHSVEEASQKPVILQAVARDGRIAENTFMQTEVDEIGETIKTPHSDFHE